MHLSEFARRSIVLPLNIKAGNILGTCNDIPENVIKDLQILQLNSIFDMMLDSMFFVDLGKILQCEISDYEDYNINESCIVKLCELIEADYLQNDNKYLKQFFEDLRKMCTDALLLKVNLYLVL